ncbi:MAG: TolB family protein [Solirubrobacterales bacterium]
MARILIVIAALASASGALYADTASAAFPGSPGLVALQRSADPNASDIWTLNWQTGAARLLTHRGYNAEPAFSPDGRWVAFRSDASKYGRLNIWAIQANKKGLHRLTLGHGELDAGSPTFSANGRWVAFTAEAPQGGYEIDRVALSGGHRRVLVPGTAKASAFAPSYSSDGRHLVWVGAPEVLIGKARPHLFIGDPNGRGVRRLTLGNEPEFSPDGDSIVFARERECASYRPGTEIVTLSLLTGQQWHVETSCAAQLADPTYSPDGTWIAYTIYSPDKSELGFAQTPNATPSFVPLAGFGTELPVDEAPTWQPVG